MSDNIREFITVVSSDTKPEIPFPQLAEQLLFMVARSHFWHLQTKSYEAHKALDDFYDELQDLVDAVIEAGINLYGQLLPTNNEYYFDGVNNALGALTTFKEMCVCFHETCSKKEQIGITNPLEDIITLCDSTLYKLKYLK